MILDIPEKHVEFFNKLYGSVMAAGFKSNITKPLMNLFAACLREDSAKSIALLYQYLIFVEHCLRVDEIAATIKELRALINTANK